MGHGIIQLGDQRVAFLPFGFQGCDPSDSLFPELQNGFPSDLHKEAPPV